MCAVLGVLRVASVSLFWRRKGKRGQHFRTFKNPSIEATDEQHVRFCVKYPFVSSQKWHARPIGYLLFEQNNSVWPNPKHWLRKLHQQAHRKRSFNNKHSDNHRVGPYPNVLTATLNVCQCLSVNIDGQLTSNRLRETPFTSFPMSDAGYRLNELGLGEV